MVDLQSISHALQEIVTSDSPNEENFTQLVERYLQSPDLSVRLLVLEILDDIITEDGSQEELDRRKEFIFKNTILTYFPLILPLYQSSPDTVSSLLLTATQMCNAREGVLALNEACQILEEKLEKFEVSDDGSGSVADEEMDSEDEEDDAESVIHQFGLIIQCYSMLFPRLINMKSTPTLLTFSDASSPLFQRVAMGIMPTQADSLLENICDLTEKAWGWSEKSSDAGGEQKTLLIQLFLMSITLLYSNSQSSPLSKYFFSQHPQYITPNVSLPSDTSLSQKLISTASTLSLNVDTLIHKLFQSSFSINIYTPIACICLLGELLSMDGSNRSTRWPEITSIMVPLTSALSGRIPENTTVILFEVLQDGKSSTMIDYDQASSFIELLVPLASMNPNPSLRLAYTKLIRLIIMHTSQPPDQIRLLQQIQEPSNPFERFKIQALVILRELIMSKSILRSELSTVIPLIPRSEDIREGSDAEWLEDDVKLTLLADRITTLRLILVVDGDNKSRIRDKDSLAGINASLESLRVRVESLKSQLGGSGVGSRANEDEKGEKQDSNQLDIMRKQFEVERLGEAISRLVESMAG